MFSGLDPVNQEVMRDAVLELRNAGTTILFSTHDMSQAERMCDAIWMIYKGKVVLDGTLESIRAKHGGDKVLVEVDGATRETLAAVPGVAEARDVGNRFDLRLDRGVERSAVLRSLMALGEVRHFDASTASLQDIFVSIANPDAKDLEAA